LQRDVRLFVIATALFVPAVLLLDGAGLLRQLSLAAATAAFLGFFAVRLDADPRPLLVAIAVASLGECVLSIGLGLYSYRSTTLVPAFVPFGHGLFYLLASVTAQQSIVQRHRVAIGRTVLIGGSVAAVAALLIVRDEWGLLWWVIAAALMARSRNRLLLSVCCAYTVALELLGTALGNWRWEPRVLGLHSANPPSGVGVLYVVLDLVTVAICARREFTVQARRSATGLRA
jgi:hypothetical protein